MQLSAARKQHQAQTGNESFHAYWPFTDMIAGDDAGMLLRFDLDDSRQVRVKVALSYTSIENAAENLEKELSGWDFYSVRDNAQAVWDEMLGRIDVQGGTTAQKVKFYTDLWHVFLGRHKINDVNGSYTGTPSKGAVSSGEIGA